MRQYKTFYFEKFSFDRNSWEAVFVYSFDSELFFEEKIYFFDEQFLLRKDINLEIIHTILFHIHIALWISYYKFFPTQKWVIKTGVLSEKSLSFWNKFYLHWLGEFFYKNKINPKNVLQFSCLSQKQYVKQNFLVSEKYLVPIGWGKDSIVSIELLKTNVRKNRCSYFCSKW